MITKWENDSRRYEIENAFKNPFFDPNKDEPLTWFLKQVERLNELYQKCHRRCAYENTQKIWRRTGACTEEQVHRAMLHRRKQINVLINEETSPKKYSFISEELTEAQFKQELTVKINERFIDLLFKYKSAFATDKEPLGAIIGHKVDIILNVEKPYPPLLRRPAYPASPRPREALEVHIKEAMDLMVLRKVGHNKQVEVNKPVIISLHNEKERMVGEFRALNTYTIPDRYSIPRMHDTSTQLSQAMFITTMDALKGFHQNFLSEYSKELLKKIVHCGIYEYLRKPFDIKNAPSHYQRLMNTTFPEELSEGWLILYIDDIIVCSETWENH
ncbi:hypothetical protein O181_029355 [Austropuccinia psidii MF-1]|uniref:Reverse transcriptase domain-containing protein n=1 Tax=Austropuccinia psidii MF-1 TaxID=1389203 RepID=A0A9Q3H543_9BASI|nr:hypothetical protein [Austropuccinia psidii MF-1]